MNTFLGTKITTRARAATLGAGAGLLLATTPACTAVPADTASTESAYSTVEEGTPEANAIVRLSNELSIDALTAVIGRPVANNVMTVRLGDDGASGTADDVTFRSLAQLDAVPLVTAEVIAKLLTYALAHGMVPSVAPNSGACHERYEAGYAAWKAYHARYFAGRTFHGTYGVVGVVFDNRPNNFVLEIRHDTESSYDGPALYRDPFYVALTPEGEPVKIFSRGRSEFYGQSKGLRTIRFLRNGDALLANAYYSYTGEKSIALMHRDGSVVEYTVPWDAIGRVEELDDGNLLLRQGHGGHHDVVQTETIDRTGKWVAGSSGPAERDDWDTIKPEPMCGF